MDFIEKMSNEELMKEYDWMVRRIHNLGTDDYDYKEKLRIEILKRLNKEI